MNQPQLQVWIPLLVTILANLIVVVFAAWMNTKSLSAQMDGLRNELHAEIGALRAETKQGFAELRLEFHQGLSELSTRLDRLDRRVERLADSVASSGPSSPLR